MPPTQLLRSVIRAPKERVTAAASSFCGNLCFYLDVSGKPSPPIEVPVGGHQPIEEGERETLVNLCVVMTSKLF